VFDELEDRMDPKAANGKRTDNETTKRLILPTSVTRRTFIRSTGLVAGAVAAGPLLCSVWRHRR